MAKKIIYAVSKGCYSDYCVVALFTTKKRAEDFKKMVKSDEYNDIEEFVLNPPTSDLIRRGYSMWRVLMLRDGTTEFISREESYDYPIENYNIWERTKAPAYRDKNIPDVLTSRVWAKTEKQAIKIVNEKRAQMIAMGEW